MPTKEQHQPGPQRDGGNMGGTESGQNSSGNDRTAPGGGSPKGGTNDAGALPTDNQRDQPQQNDTGDKKRDEGNEAGPHEGGAGS